MDKILSQMSNSTKPSWFPVRVIRKFADAIMEQSEHSDSPNQRSSSMISYCVSPFAAICMTTAIFLNRIVVFASSSSISRNRKKLPFVSHVILRLIALYLLFNGSYGVLVALKLKLDKNSNPIIRFLLSPSYFDYQYEEFKTMKFLGLPYISKSFLDFNQANTTPELLLKSPSPSVLKPLYLSLCLGQIMETFIALTNGNDPLVENGLTLFEYSLAFQEVQSAGIPSFELIVIAMVAVVNQMIIHVLGLFHLERYRLIPSSLVGSYILSFYFFSILNGRLLYFPFIVVMGYLPQLLTFFIIVLCMSIFLLAAIVKGSFRDLEFSKITDNLNSINILMTDDFYTALTNLGTFMITAAGKASYVKEISEVTLGRRTWLENNQLQQRKSFISKITGYKNQVDVPPELQGLREKNSNQRATGGSGRWITIKRGEYLKNLLTNFKEVLVSFLVTKKMPNFLKHQVNDSSTDCSLMTFDNEDIELWSEDEEDDDYEFNGEEEENETDFSESDFETSSLAVSRSNGMSLRHDETALQELIASPEDLLALVTSEQQQQNTSPVEPSSLDLRILRAHLLKQDSKIITRSKFNSSILEPSNKLLDLIIEKRSRKHSHEGHIDNEDSDEDSDEGELPSCVICQTNPREIILWPCKCLAICESCRVSLIVRSFNDCVCCRRKVELYSKVFIP